MYVNDAGQLPVPPNDAPLPPLPRCIHGSNINASFQALKRSSIDGARIAEPLSSNHLVMSGKWDPAFVYLVAVMTFRYIIHAYSRRLQRTDSDRTQVRV
jgi:hypothetical protein